MVAKTLFILFLLHVRTEYMNKLCPKTCRWAEPKERRECGLNVGNDDAYYDEHNVGCCDYVCISARLIS